MDEMTATERDYVRSLHYVMEHYFPEMERPDLPQDLRGKRGTVFGNVEKLSDFHSRYFLKELESCSHAPLSVSGCFLRHVSPPVLLLAHTRSRSSLHPWATLRHTVPLYRRLGDSQGVNLRPLTFSPKMLNKSCDLCAKHGFTSPQIISV